MRIRIVLRRNEKLVIFPPNGNAGNWKYAAE
jgi:hypothetical protein